MTPSIEAFGRRRALAVLMLLLAPSTLAYVGAAPASACSCATTTLRQAVAGSDTVALVTVLEDGPDDGEEDLAVLDVAVEAVYRGQAGRGARIETAGQSSACGLTDLRAGDRRIVLVDDRAEVWPVGLCGGALEATAGRVARLEALLGPPRAPQGPGLPRRSEASDLPVGTAAGAATVVVLAGLGVVAARRRWRRTG